MQESIDRNCCYDPSIQYYDEEGNGLMLNSLEFPKSTPLISPRVGFNYDVSGDGTAQLRGGTGMFSNYSCEDPFLNLELRTLKLVIFYHTSSIDNLP